MHFKSTWNALQLKGTGLYAPYTRYFIRKWLDVKLILKEYFHVSEGWELMLFDVTEVKPDETDEHLMIWELSMYKLNFNLVH